MKLKFVSIFVSGVALVACSKSSSNGGSSDTATSTSTASGFDDLSLSSALSITLPSSIKGSGSAATLKLDGQKSFEACKMRGEIRESISQLTQANSMLCMLENDPNLEFGKKYNIDIAGMMGGAGAGTGAGAGAGAGGGAPGMPPAGPTLTEDSASEGPSMPDSLQVWVDNSVSGQLTVWMCQDKVLNQMFKVDGVKDGKIKGSMIMKHSMDMGQFAMSFHHSATFDNGYTTTGNIVLNVKDLINTTFDGQTQVGRRLVALDLVDSGVSKVASSFSGTVENVTSSFAALGYFASDFGSVVAKGNFGDFEISNASYFDAANNVVDPSLYAAAFGTDGTVKVVATDVPAYPTDTFSPDAFPADAWDCTGTEDMELKMPETSASGTDPMQACMTEWSELDEENCNESGFGKGQAVEVPQGSEQDPSKFEGFKGE